MQLQAGQIYPLSITMAKDTTPPPSGEPTVDVLDLSFDDYGPKVGGKVYPYTLRLRNNYGSRIPRFSHGCWWMSWWSEGRWNDDSQEAFETKDCHGNTKIPAEPMDYGAQLTFGYSPQFKWADGTTLSLGTHGWTKYGMSTVITQNPDTLSPYGEPPIVAPWSGVKDFPVPVTPYGHLKFENIALPMPGSSVTGEVVMSLPSPALIYKDGSGRPCNGMYPGLVGIMSPTEKRYGLSEIGYTDSPYFYYQISIRVYKRRDFPGGQPVTYKTFKQIVRSTEPGGLYSFPIQLTTGLSSGTYQIHIRGSIDTDEKGYALFWSPEESRYCIYPCIATLKV